MDRDVLIAIRNLLDTRRVLALAAVVDGDPEAALLPFAVRADYGALYVQSSTLARHSRALTTGARVGLLVHAPESPDSDPMQLPRLTLRAEVRTIDKDSAEFVDAAARFIERFPGAEMTLNLGDFSLHELTLGRGRYVEGFARAFNVGPGTLKELG
jgi:putative heme iron utilization protein